MSGHALASLLQKGSLNPDPYNFCDLLGGKGVSAVWGFRGGPLGICDARRFRVCWGPSILEAREIWGL